MSLGRTSRPRALLHTLQGSGRGADYGGVWSRTFADVLDDALGVTAGPAVPSSRGASTPTISPVNPFLFFTVSAAAGGRGTYAPAAWGDGRLQSIAIPPASTEVPRPVRTLTALQQRAVNLLTTCGARLTSDFTLLQLRREYRQLARRLHPDRHPDCSAAERARLSRQFAEASNAYRQLLAATASTN